MLLILKLPAFLLAVYVMYWSLPLANLLLFIKAWKVVGNRNDMYRWCQFLVRACGIKVRKCGKQELYRGGACLYLANHRSWADFFVDAYLTEGRGQLMSRAAVIFVFPVVILPLTLVRGCICFRRDGVKDKEKFNRWIDACIGASPVPGICLFPEGHRSRLPHSLPLKRGMLNYAYSRKMPVQIVISAHKELAMDEKSFHVRFGATCVTGYGPLMRTADYASFDEFYTALQGEWQKLWVEVFSADPAALPELVISAPAGFTYPLQLKLSQLLLTLLELALMAWGLAWSVRAWGGVAARLAGTLQLGVSGLQVLQYLPLVWLVVSLASCYDSTLPQPVLAADGTPLVGSSQATRDSKKAL
ncbi:hypothetical protein COO60DRAFT_1003924 [Scenedesmus sp. NREL 46B-D3]|nr:hypothetical protein COO60DRAFT_1003924 [Scenedesmus sp. NREL 46B-D3]